MRAPLCGGQGTDWSSVHEPIDRLNAMPSFQGTPCVYALLQPFRPVQIFAMHNIGPLVWTSHSLFVFCSYRCTLGKKLRVGILAIMKCSRPQLLQNGRSGFLERCFYEGDQPFGLLPYDADCPSRHVDTVCCSSVGSVRCQLRCIGHLLGSPGADLPPN